MKKGRKFCQGTVESRNLQLLYGINRQEKTGKISGEGVVELASVGGATNRFYPDGQGGGSSCKKCRKGAG
jgi:hypothetical protein